MCCINCIDVNECMDPRPAFTREVVDLYKQVLDMLGGYGNRVDELHCARMFEGEAAEKLVYMIEDKLAKEYGYDDYQCD